MRRATNNLTQNYTRVIFASQAEMVENGWIQRVKSQIYNGLCTARPLTPKVYPCFPHIPAKLAGRRAVSPDTIGRLKRLFTTKVKNYDSGLLHELPDQPQ